MQRSARSTRSTANPGLIDRPNPHRSSAVVAEEKAQKKQAATLKAEERRRRIAQVAEVEKEVRKAQEEVQQVGQRGRGKLVKKTFPRPAADVNVSSYRRALARSAVFPPTLTPHASPPPTQATKVNRGKRNAEMAELSDPELTTVAAKSSRCVSPTRILFDSLNNNYRTIGSSSPRSYQDTIRHKPAGLAGHARAAIMHPAMTAADEDDEPIMLTEDEEIDDNLRYSGGSADTLMRPPAFHLMRTSY